MKKLLLLLTLLGSLTALADETLASGDVTLNANQNSDGTYSISFTAFGQTFNSGTTRNPTLYINCKGQEFYPTYDSADDRDSCMVLTATVKYDESTTLLVTDRFQPEGDGAFSLWRSVDVQTTTDDEQDGFYSSFGLQHAVENTFEDLDKFVPGVLYNVCFTEQGNMPSGSIKASDTDFLYRDDRTTLPVVMLRDKQSGVAFTVIVADSPCSTILDDVKNRLASADYQFGGVGITKRTQTDCYAAVATWPGNDMHAGGKGIRRHPLVNGGKFHQYHVYFKIEKTRDYAESIAKAWDKAFDLYNPTVYETDQMHAYDALLNTLDYYYLSPIASETKQQVAASAPGFPWSIKLTDFSIDWTTYELGFVGSQPASGFSMMRAGLDAGKTLRKKCGTNVIDFWANEGLSVLGFPKCRYRSDFESWDKFPCSMRQACSGLTEVLEAWCYYRKYDGTNKAKWIEACRRFGDWLVCNQNEDGSFYMEYDPNVVTDGKHPATKKNKNLTICAVRYLVELYLATDKPEYLDAAKRAAEWAYTNNHLNYAYVACVIDNPECVDSESGQQAMQGFLSLYDATKEQKWLDAAIQAAKYTETFTFMHEVPVETDQKAKTEWPRDRSVVGQHYIAAAHSAADLGFAWSSFHYFRLYVITGNEHWLKVARIAAHNSKQSMNLYKKLYPTRQEGLQLEASTLRTSDKPRRMGCVLETLTWNFAAHLDPMNRLMDAYGTPDIEKAAAMPIDELRELDRKYAVHQSADCGDKEEVLDDIYNGEGDGLTGEYWEGSSDFGNPIPSVYRNTDFHKSPQQDQPGEYRFTRVDPVVNFDWGNGNPFNDSKEDESFSVKWTGYLLAPVTGKYNFSLTRCDDAFSFKLFNPDNLTSPICKYDNEYIGKPGFGFNWDKPSWKFSSSLKAGEFYYVELLYFENAGGAHINLRWQITGKASYYCTIPQSQLYTKLPDPNGIASPESVPVGLFASDRSLHIVGAAGRHVGIYNTLGECVLSETLSADKSLSLPRGVYIVKVAGSTRKIAVR